MDTPTALALNNAAEMPAPGPLAAIGRMPLRAKLMLVLGAAGLIAVAVSLLMWSQVANQAPLFATGLSDKDVAPVLDQLRQAGVNPRLLDGGVVMVPADRVPELRAKLSAANLPKAPSTGFALMDNARFGQTQMQERVQFQRALQDTLAERIGQFTPVQSASVTLALPQQNGFYREQQKPTASVVVTLRSGYTLDRAQVASIVGLVANSVSDLAPKNVALSDQHGNPLAGNAEAAANGLDSQQLQYVQQVEASYTKRVIDLLEPALGRDNLRATVTAEVDFSQLESTSEEFKPNQSGAAAIRSSRNAESAGAGGTAPSGTPGAASNQPPLPATAPITGASAPLQAAQGGAGAGTGANNRRDSAVNYEVDKTVSVRRNAVGQVRRLTAAVIVNHRSVTDAKGRTTTTPLTPEELEKFTTLAREAIGFNKERGDSIKIVNIPFRAEPAPKAEELPLLRQPWLTDLLRAAAVPAALALFALLLVFAVIRPALKQVRASSLAAGGGNAFNAVVDDPQALPGGAMPIALAAPRSVQQLEQMRALAKQNPAAVANVVRGWVSGESA